MTATDAALHDKQALIEEMRHMRARFELLKQHWSDRNGLGEEAHVLERASSWIGNLTDPLSPEESALWEETWSENGRDETRDADLDVLAEDWTHEDRREYAAYMTSED